MRAWAYPLLVAAFATAGAAPRERGAAAGPPASAPTNRAEAGPLAAQTAGSAPAQVSGIVTDASTGQPLNKASVELVPVRGAGSGPVTFMRMTVVGGNFPGGPSSARTSTDADGRFEFAHAQPGEYRVRVLHNGYVAEGYDARGAGDPGRRLSLEPGTKVTDLRIALTPAGVVTGRVTDEDGSPLPWVGVQVLALSYDVQGVKRVFPIGSGSTDDRGMYRVFGLAPGRYYVEATYQSGREMPGFGAVYAQGPDSGSSAQAYPRQVFYPGVTDPANASEVSVAGGQETAEINFSLSQSAVYQVSGKVTSAGGSTGSGPQAMPSFGMLGGIIEMSGRVFISGGGDARLVPQGAENMGLRPYFAPISTRGQFQFQNVPPGSYTLIATQQMAGGKRAVGEIPVAVSENVTGLDVALQPAIGLQGQVTLDGQSSGANSSRSFRIFLRPTSNLVGGMNAYGREAQDGKFVLQGVFPGSYWVEVEGLPEGAYVKSVRFGTQDALAKPLEIPSGGTSESLSVVVGLDGAQIGGTVMTGSEHPAGGATVVLIPDAPLRGVSALYHVTSTDQTGSFSFAGIRPGSYTLFAWDEVAQGEWFDPVFLKAAEGMGKGIEVGEGQRMAVTLALIAAAGPSSNGQP